MKKIIAVLLSVFLMFSLCACAKKGKTLLNVSSGITYTETTSDIAEAEIDGEYTFAFNPYVISSEAVNGMKGNECYNKFVSAIMNRDSVVSISTREEYDNIRFAIGEYFPFTSLVESFRYSSVDMAILITYKYEAEEHNNIISKFRSEVEKVLLECVERKDDSAIAAISLYNWISSNITVIKTAQSSDNAVSSGIAQTETSFETEKYDIYSTLLDKKGSEKSISALYGFLLKQLGIDTKVVSAWSENTFRTWNMVYINKKWYHCDIASEQKATNGEGLNFFGMTKSEVKTMLSVDKICTGEWNWYTEKIPNASSKKFEDFRNIESFNISTDRKGIEAFTKEFSRFIWEI